MELSQAVEIVADFVKRQGFNALEEPEKGYSVVRIFATNGNIVGALMILPQELTGKPTDVCNLLDAKAREALISAAREPGGRPKAHAPYKGDVELAKKEHLSQHFEVRGFTKAIKAKISGIA